MITPALDLQAAPQMVDGVRAQAAQPDGSSDNGEFGAAFTASLSSSSSATPVMSNSETSGAQKFLQQNLVSARNPSDRSASIQKVTVSMGSTVTGVRLPVKTTALTLLHAEATDSSVDALSEALAAVTTKSGAALANSLDGKAGDLATGNASEPVQTVAVDPSLSLQSKDAAVADKASSIATAKLAEFQASLASASRPLPLEASENTNISTPVKAGEVAGKIKAATHDSQPGAATVTGDVLLTSLGVEAVLTVPADLTAPALAKETPVSVEAGNGSKAQFLLPGQDPGISASGLSVPGTAVGKGNVAIAWNSVAIEAASARNALVRTASGVTGLAPVHALGLSGSSSAEVAAPGPHIGLFAAAKLPTPPIHWLTSPVTTDVVQSSEVAASPAPASAPAVPGQELRSEAVSTGVPSASSGNTTAASTAIATDTLSSSIPGRSQTASVAGRSLDSAGQGKSTTAGVFVSAMHAAEEMARTESARGTGVTATPASSAQADVKVAPNGDQPRQVATPVAAIVAAPATIKQSAVQTERPSTSHPAVTAAGTQAASSSHHGSLENSTATPDRGAGSDADNNVVTAHGDSSTAVISPHTATTPALDLSNGSITAPASLATMAHQGPSGAANFSTTTAAGAIGPSGLQAAGTEPLHGASALNAAISSQPHQTLAATPTSLEVGVHSGTQGWLKIRAEVGEHGDVTASLAAASTSGQQSLKGQLPALNAYLQSEQMSVTTSVAERIGATHVAVAHEATLGSSAAGTGSTGQDTSLLQSGAGQGAFLQGEGRQGSGPNPSSGTGDSGREEALQTYVSRGESSGSAPTSTTGDGSGRWLNVRV